MTARTTIVNGTIPILLVMLAGCMTPGAPPDAAVPLPGPALSCDAPCLRVIDAGTRWEPTVALDPTDAGHLVASSQDQSPDPMTGARQSWGLSHVSFDAGVTWRTVRIPGGGVGDPGHPLFPYNWMDDSVAAFLPDGTVLWTALVFKTLPRMGTDSGAALVALRSSDGGLTFPDVSVVEDGEGWRGPGGVGPVDLFGYPGVAYEIQDKQWPAIAPDGSVLLVWSRNQAGTATCPDPLGECSEIVYSTSADGGRTWSPSGVVQGDGLYSGAFPLIRDDGAWVVSFRDTTESTIRVSISTDKGATWGTSESIDLTTKFPVLAKTRGPAGERINMAYPMGDDGHDGAQVLHLRWSDDGGVTWSDALALDVPEHDGRTIPAMVPIGDDAVLVTYWHVRAEDADLRAILVRNGTASPAVTLDTTQGSTSVVGDYMGLAALPDRAAFAVWGAQREDGMRLNGARISTR